MLSMKFCIYAPKKKGWRFKTRIIEVQDINNPNMEFGKREMPKALTIQEYAHMVRSIRCIPNVSYNIIKGSMDI